MRREITIMMAAASVLVASDHALAKHGDDHSFPWVQTQSVRGPKTQQRASEHWGKHHHHGIYLEGSDYEHAPVQRYD